MSDNETTTVLDPATEPQSSHIPKHRAVVAAAVVLGVLGIGVGGAALHHAGVNQGREQAAAATTAAPVTAPTLPVLRSNDGTCGSRLDLYADGRVYALMLDGERDFRVLDITEEAKEPGGGCSLGMQFPDGPRTEDSTGARSAKVLTGWDTQANRCAKFVTIDGRRWILDGADAGGAYLAYGGSGRILAGDARCGGEVPMQPWGGAGCRDHGAGWVYQWDAVLGQCAREVPDAHRGQPQGQTVK